MLSLQAFAEKRNKRELARVIVFGSWVLFDSFCVLNTIRFGYNAEDRSSRGNTGGLQTLKDKIQKQELFLLEFGF